MQLFSLPVGFSEILAMSKFGEPEVFGFTHQHICKGINFRNGKHGYNKGDLISTIISFGSFSEIINGLGFKNDTSSRDFGALA